MRSYSPRGLDFCAWFFVLYCVSRFGLGGSERTRGVERPFWAEAMLARCSAAKYSALEMAPEPAVEEEEFEVEEERKPIVSGVMLKLAACCC